MDHKEYIKAIESLDEEKETLKKRIQEIEDQRRDLILGALTENYVGKFIHVENGPCSSWWMKVETQSVNGDHFHPTILLAGYGVCDYKTAKTRDIRFSAELTYVIYLERKGKDMKWTITNGNLQEVSCEDFEKAIDRLVRDSMRICVLQRPHN